MNKRVMVGVVLLFLVMSAIGGFAASQNLYPWMTSHNKPGHLNAYAAIGYYYGGFSGTAGAEIILGQFDIASIPLEWGIMGQGIIGNNSFNPGIDWGAAPLVALHWGVDFGKPRRFDLYAAIGLGVYGGAYQNFFFSSSPIGLGFASYDGVSWLFSDNIALMLEYGYIGWTSVFGIGLQFKL